MSKFARPVLWAVVISGSALFLWTASHLTRADLSAPLLLLCAAAVLSEFTTIQTAQINGERWTFSLSLAVTGAAITIVPMGTPVITTVGVITHIILRRMKRLDEILFNFGNLALGPSIAAWLFVWLSQLGGSNMRIIAGAAAVTLDSVLNYLLVFLIVSLHTGAPLKGIFKASRHVLASTAVGVLGGLAGSSYETHGWISLLLFAIPGLLLHYQLNMYVQQSDAAITALKTAQSLETENARIADANRLKSEFLANMSHELRTPLNVVIGFSQLMEDGRVPPQEYEECAGEIRRSGTHLLELIDDVLDLSKLDAGKVNLQPEEVDLTAVTTSVANSLRQMVAEKQVTLSLQADLPDSRAWIDPLRYRQVLYNYLSNAIKYTPDRGLVSIRLSPEGASAFRLSVTDTGIGIAPQDLPRLFVPFQQLDGGHGKRHQGAGLGLSLTKQLVLAMGGQVGVESSPGAGSTFYAILPIRPGTQQLSGS